MTTISAEAVRELQTAVEKQALDLPDDDANVPNKLTAWVRERYDRWPNVRVAFMEENRRKVNAIEMAAAEATTPYYSNIKKTAHEGGEYFSDWLAGMGRNKADIKRITQRVNQYDAYARSVEFSTDAAALKGGDGRTRGEVLEDEYEALRKENTKLRRKLAKAGEFILPDEDRLPDAPKRSGDWDDEELDASSRNIVTSSLSSGLLTLIGNAPADELAADVAKFFDLRVYGLTVEQVEKARDVLTALIPLLKQRVQQEEERHRDGLASIGTHVAADPAATTVDARDDAGEETVEGAAQ